MSKTTSKRSPRAKGEGTIQKRESKNGVKWRARLPITNEEAETLGLKNTQYWGPPVERKADAIPEARRKLKNELQKLEELGAKRLSESVDQAIQHWEKTQEQTTVDLKKTLRDKHLVGTALWDCPVALITERMVREFAVNIVGGKHTKRNVASLITASLKLIDGIHLRHGQKFKYKPKFVILTNADKKKMIEAARDESDRIAVLLALRCGLRRGELAGLHSSHIKIVNNRPRAYLKDQMVTTRDKHFLKDLKTEESENWIPIDQETYEAIKDREGFILTGTETPKLPKTAGAAITRTARLAGLSDKVTPHTLRHNCAQTWLSAGVPIPQCARMLRHSIQVFLSTYVRPDEDGLEDFAAKIHKVSSQNSSRKR